MNAALISIMFGEYGGNDKGESSRPDQKQRVDIAVDGGHNSGIQRIVGRKQVVITKKKRKLSLND